MHPTDVREGSTQRMPPVALPVPAPARAPIADHPPVPRGSTREPGPRPDIQGLRAVAVGLVVLYHLRPDVLGGGFVGVDVFFVISGFLIVGSLGREAARTGTISLRDFYARRVRRLLPASTLVLLVVMTATVLLMPVSRWRTTAEGLIASVLQSQNWWQAFNSGYESATAAVSPLQHYWSLAVEEQFYVVAPLAIVGACRLSARLGRARSDVVVAVVAALAVLSFAHSVTFSQSHHDIAYFATTTRVWELACGGLLALLGSRLQLPAAAARASGSVGLAAVLGSSLAFSTAMQFPGWLALIPVLGTVLVIMGGRPRTADAAIDRVASPGLVQRLLRSRPFTFVGDMSYSLYLWHWPVIVFFTFWVNRVPTKFECLGLTAVALVLAHVSTRYVERPFRHPRGRGGRSVAAAPRRGALRLTVVVTALSMAAGLGPWLYVQQRTANLGDQRLDAQHTGGASVLPAQLPPSGDVSVIPDPALAAEDVPIIARTGCPPFDPRKVAVDSCLYGDTTSPLTVALAGDSHAGQFSTPLEAIAEAEGWRLQSMVRNGCPFTAAPILMGGQPDFDCAVANAITRDALLKSRPQVLVTSAMQPEGYEAFLEWTWESWEVQVEGYRELLAPLAAAGIRVVVVRDPPTPDYAGPECVETQGPDSPECSMTRQEAMAQRDPLVEAAARLDGAVVIDMTDHFCNEQICPGVIGNVLVYRDNHLTDTFALSLASTLRDALRSLV